jgi:hypothetical protein
LWARNGRELYYLDLANTLTAVPVQRSAATFIAGNPTKLFATESRDYWTRDYDVSSDSQHFLLIKQHVSSGRNRTAAGSAVVVVNWFEELNAKVPAGK